MRKQGLRVLREGGRHTLVSNGRAEIAVPRHGTLKTGTVAAILAQAEVPPEQWSDL